MMNTRKAYLMVLTGLLMVNTAQAITITVGASGCNYIGMQYALDSVDGILTDFVTFRMVAGTIPIDDGILVKQAADRVNFEGGYANCSDAAPTPGLRTVLDASGGHDGTAIEVIGRNLSPRQVVTFSNTSIRGGSSETHPFANPEGGGLEIRGEVDVVLREGSTVEENRSGKGAGVYLNGRSSSRRAQLILDEGSTLIGNTASNRGGGIYCHSHGSVRLRDGQISFNDGYQGGGIYLNTGCTLRAESDDDADTVMIANNHAVTDGGGIYLRADSTHSSPVWLEGSPVSPVMMINNVAGNHGGGLFAISTSGQDVQFRYPYLRNTIWVGQRARVGGAISLWGNVGLLLWGDEDCSYNLFGRPGCSSFDYNTATQGAGAIATNGMGRQSYIYGVRTRFENNRGVPAAIGPRHELLVMEAAIFRNNTALNLQGLPGSGSLIASPVRSRLAYSSFLENSTSVIFDSGAGSLDVTGSIIWDPGTPIWRRLSGGRFIHNACLIAHSSLGLPGGVMVASPQLQADFTPGPWSPAIDVCNTHALRPMSDFYGNPRGVNLPGNSDFLGPYDLGAVERQN